DQRRSGCVLDVANRRESPVSFRIFIHAAKITIENAADIGGTLETHPICNTRTRDCCLEPVGVGDRPVREESTTAPATDNQLIRVGYPLVNDIINTGHQILPVRLAVAVDDATQEIRPATG